MKKTYIIQILFSGIWSNFSHLGHFECYYDAKRSAALLGFPQDQWRIVERRELVLYPDAVEERA